MLFYLYSIWNWIVKFKVSESDMLNLKTVAHTCTRTYTYHSVQEIKLRSYNTEMQTHSGLNRSFSVSWQLGRWSRQIGHSVSQVHSEIHLPSVLFLLSVGCFLSAWSRLTPLPSTFQFVRRTKERKEKRLSQCHSLNVSAPFAFPWWNSGMSATGYIGGSEV